jgi:hypothetical protein
VPQWSQLKKRSLSFGAGRAEPACILSNQAAVIPIGGGDMLSHTVRTKCFRTGQTGTHRGQENILIERYQLVFNRLATSAADGMRIAEDCAKGKFLYING